MSYLSTRDASDFAIAAAARGFAEDAYQDAAKKRGEQLPIAARRDAAQRAAVDAVVMAEAHTYRARRAERIRQALNWRAPHVHYSIEPTRPLARRSRRHVHRFLASIVDAGSREGARAVISAAWGGRVAPRAAVAATGDRRRRRARAEDDEGADERSSAATADAPGGSGATTAPVVSPKTGQ